MSSQGAPFSMYELGVPFFLFGYSNDFSNRINTMLVSTLLGWCVWKLCVRFGECPFSAIIQSLAELSSTAGSEALSFPLLYVVTYFYVLRGFWLGFLYFFQNCMCKHFHSVCGWQLYISPVFPPAPHLLLAALLPTETIFYHISASKIVISWILIEGRKIFQLNTL